MDERRFCVDCKWYSRLEIEEDTSSCASWKFRSKNRCSHPQALNHVTKESTSCEWERSTGNCEEEAKNYQPKEKENENT